MDEENLRLLAHELRNTLFATDMLLERALEHEELGTDPMDDVKRARAGVQETLAIVKRRLGPHDEAQPPPPEAGS
jgi:hypothetical protein